MKSILIIAIIISILATTTGAILKILHLHFFTEIILGIGLVSQLVVIISGITFALKIASPANKAS